jgi:hypothetical protein
MRTKTLLLTAACAVLGTVAASAQSVYSVNAVGYVNVTLPKGWSIVANPLNTTNNVISNVLANLPDNTMIYAWTGSAYKQVVYYSDGTWDGDAAPLAFAPGTAVWIKNNSGAVTTVTFVGEVPQGSLTNAITVGYSLKGSIVPQSGALDTVLGYTPSDLDLILLYRNGAWASFNYYAGDGWDTSSAPVPAVGEGFFIKSKTAHNWVRSFTIN